MAMDNKVNSIANAKVPSLFRRTNIRGLPSKRGNGFGSIVSEKLKSDSSSREPKAIAIGPNNKQHTVPSASDKRNLSGSSTVAKKQTMPNPPPPPPNEKQLRVAALKALAEAFGQINDLSGSLGDDAEQSGQTISAVVSNDQEIWEELYKRPGFGEIYKAVVVDVEHTKQYLKDLSKNLGEATIDEGLEIADAASLLKFKRKSSLEIEMAGQKAQRAAVLLLQAHMMSNKGKKLLAESKHMLQSADF